jgi:hypothetical protein
MVVRGAGEVCTVVKEVPEPVGTEGIIETVEIVIPELIEADNNHEFRARGKCGKQGTENDENENEETA